MGGGEWTKDAFETYASSRGRSVDSSGAVKGDYSARQLYESRSLAPELNPYRVIRECRDSEEHPETKPVILALDVTGSMGKATVEIAKELNIIMKELYKKVKDVEFLIMGIGDLAYDKAPIQASQFESDIRIAEQLDKIYFEGGGGPNRYESYTAAWYFGLQHTDLDCWKRGKKGIIITIGDEPLNPYLPAEKLISVIGNVKQSSDKCFETKYLYEAAYDKFDIYHLAVDDNETCYYYNKDIIEGTFGEYLDSEHLLTVKLNNLSATIVKIITAAFENSKIADTINNKDGISW